MHVLGEERLLTELQRCFNQSFELIIGTLRYFTVQSHQSVSVRMNGTITQRLLNLPGFLEQNVRSDGRANITSCLMHSVPLFIVVKKIMLMSQLTMGTVGSLSVIGLRHVFFYQ